MFQTLTALLIVAVSAVFSQTPDIIIVNSTGLSPEGIEWHPTIEQFLLSSSEGTVFLAADNGDLTPFVQSPELIGSLGLQVDKQVFLLSSQLSSKL